MNKSTDDFGSQVSQCQRSTEKGLGSCGAETELWVSGKFPDGSVVGTRCFHLVGPGSITGPGIKN